MRFKCLSFCLIAIIICNLAYSQQLPKDSQVNQNISSPNARMQFLPDQVLIQYQLINKPEPKGLQILSEYKDIKSITEKLLGISVSNSKPVSQHIVNKMIKENKTEQNIRQEYYTKKHLSKNHKINNQLQSTVNEYSSSHITQLRLDLNTGQDLLSIIDEIKQKSI